MFSKIHSLFIVLFLFSITIQAQQVKKSPFISLHTGAYVTSLENFDKTYGSKAGIVIGLGTGLPLSTRSYLYGKATLFSKSGTTIVKTYSYEGGVVSISEEKGGSADFTQWIFNVGFLYNFFLDPLYTIGLNGGANFSTVNERQKFADGSVKLSSDGKGLFGFFVGAVIERNFAGSNLSIFFEPQYNFSRNDVLQYVGDYSGLNLDLGVRYYFNERRVE